MAIQIDGDYYAPTVLSFPQYLEVLSRARMQYMTLDKKWTDCNCLSYQKIDNPNRSSLQPTRYTLLGTNSRSKSGEVQGHYGNVDVLWTSDTASSIFGWRPVLIPLEKNAKYRDNRCLKDTPEGTILHGGTIYMNGQPYRPTDNSIYENVDSFCLGDTFSQDFQLDWYYVQNMLVCTQVICYFDHTTEAVQKLIQWLEDQAIPMNQ